MKPFIADYIILLSDTCMLQGIFFHLPGLSYKYATHPFKCCNNKKMIPNININCYTLNHVCFDVGALTSNQDNTIC